MLERRFGRLLVIGPVKGERPRKWRCLCDCAVEVEVRQYNLMTGHTQSCGCLHGDRLTERQSKMVAARRHSLEGKRSGRLLILHVGHVNHHTYWKCRCDCGSEISVRSSHLRSGATRSCGCLKATNFDGEHERRRSRAEEARDLARVEQLVSAHAERDAARNRRDARVRSEDDLKAVRRCGSCGECYFVSAPHPCPSRQSL